MLTIVHLLFFQQWASFKSIFVFRFQISLTFIGGSHTNMPLHIQQTLFNFGKSV